MVGDVFVDSSGLYALADRRDPFQPEAARVVTGLAKGNGRLILTDYILDEAATLAKVRGGGHAALRLLEIVERSAGFEFVWIGPERSGVARKFFGKHAGHGYSFTDCTSFVVMKELRLTDALTTDRRFVEAGFKALLPTR